MSKNNLYKHQDSYKFNIITNIQNKVKNLVEEREEKKYR